jgi:hypothetical protein
MKSQRTWASMIVDQFCADNTQAPFCLDLSTALTALYDCLDGTGEAPNIPKPPAYSTVFQCTVGCILIFIRDASG